MLSWREGVAELRSQLVDHGDGTIGTERAYLKIRADPQRGGGLLSDLLCGSWKRLFGFAVRVRTDRERRQGEYCRLARFLDPWTLWAEVPQTEMR